MGCQNKKTFFVSVCYINQSGIIFLRGPRFGNVRSLASRHAEAMDTHESPMYPNVAVDHSMASNQLIVNYNAI